MKIELAVLAFATFSLTALAQPGLSEEEAIALLAQKFPAHSSGCISFLTEIATPEYFEIALHEKHNVDCGGDPATAPTSERFRVYRLNKLISKYDVILGEYSPPDKNIAK